MTGISLLVPFTPGLAEDRDRIWDWLQKYWKSRLPSAEIIMGHDETHHMSESGVPFSKTAAVNDAAVKAKGDIIVILDADAYVDSKLITYCAGEIRLARKTGRRLWFVPYRRFFRVSVDATRRVLESDPRNPLQFADPPAKPDLDTGRADPKYGHHYAAMIMIMPRAAFEEVGGMDPRFTGWGGEDISFMRAVDTIYSPHKTVDHAVYHLYHGQIGRGIKREWTGQTVRHPFALLGSRYQAAYGDRERMLRLNAEWREK